MVEGFGVQLQYQLVLGKGVSGLIWFKVPSIRRILFACLHFILHVCFAFSTATARGVAPKRLTLSITWLVSSDSGLPVRLDGEY